MTLLNVITSANDNSGTFTVSARKGAVSVNVQLDALSEIILAQLALHGLKQKLADSVASAPDAAFDAAHSDTEFSSPKAEAKARKEWKADGANIGAINTEASARMEAALQSLEDGEWSRRGESTGPAISDADIARIKLLDAWTAITADGQKVAQNVKADIDTARNAKRKELDDDKAQLSANERNAIKLNYAIENAEKLDALAAFQASL